jgi:hypothetical protein
VVAVADADPDLAAHAAALAVPLLVVEMGAVVGAVDVSRLGDNATAVGREAMEAAEQALRLRGAPEEAEVVA